MTCIQCLVILSALTCLSVSVGIRVPSSWDEAQGRDGVRNYESGMNLNQRFYNLNHPQSYSNGHLERRVLLENEHANADLGTLYNTLQSSALNNFLGRPQQMLVLSQNGLYMFPQDNQNNAPISSETNQYTNQLPALKHNPKYPENPQVQNNIPNTQYVRSINYSPNIQLMTGGNQFQNTQNLPLVSLQNGAYDQYQTLPSNVLRISPSSPGYMNWNNYNHMGHLKLKQPVLKQLAPKKYKATVHKEYAQTPAMSQGHSTQLELPVQPLNNLVSKDHTFIVSASTLSPIESDPNQADSPIEYTTKKEPIFFVTEGYRNVLIQGPNKKKTYQKPQYQTQQASKKVLSTQKLQEESANEVEKPPRKRKVTKIYKIHGNNQGQGSNVGGSSRNLVDSGWQKPRQFSRRPPVYTEYDRRLDLRNRLINNYRDDKLHEPSDDHDQEREDDDNEKIKDDEDDDINELENEDENETVNPEDTNTEDPKLENRDEDKGESDENEESDDEDAENEEEEEPQQKVPHSEHADPKPVQTGPNYPGEGVWAKPGVKHRPYVSQHRFIKPPEGDQKPDGHDVFEDLEKYFESQKDQFGRTFGDKIEQSANPVPNTSILKGVQSINPPNSVNPLIVYDPFQESSETTSQQVPSDSHIITNQNVNNGDRINTNQEHTSQDQPESDDENDTESDENNEGEQSDGSKNFVPLQLYSQVRKSENEEHEPYDPLEHGRLREVIKDSKIQTVYSEEGYEDAAYDHAGHEKKAEKDQGHEEFEREKDEEIKPKQKEETDSALEQSNKVLISDDFVEDSLPSDSIYPSLPQEITTENKDTTEITTKKPKLSSNKNFITKQEVKTTHVKDKKNGDVQLEIESEVKVIVQPNNSTKAHKYVKIYPKVLREFSKKVPEIGDQEKNNNTSNAETDNDDNNVSTMEKLEESGDETGKYSKSADKVTDPERLDIESDVKVLQEPKIPPSLSTSLDSTSTESTTSAKVSFRAFKDEFDKVTSTEKPKVTVKVLDDEEALANISDEFGKIASQVRRKRRSVDDDEDLEIDIDFIDKINHSFAEKKPDVIDVEKYPYYIRPDLNENSPLRYAENLNNIPLKKEGELSFYKMADKYACPDLPQSIDPIPEHVKNADKNAGQDDSDEYDNEDIEGDEEDDDEEYDEEESEDESIVDQKHPPAPKIPRVQLGDKIDCLKIRYFGENPFDSPFFKEETVGPVKSIFKELERGSTKIQSNKNIDNAQRTSEIIENINKVNEIFDQKEKKAERKFETEVKDKVYNALKETSDKFNTDNTKFNTFFHSEKENDLAETKRNTVQVLKPIGLEDKNTLPTPAPLVTLITTPKYTIQLTPRNIYDQIKLLDHLPEDEPEDVTEIIETTTKNIEQTTIKHVTKAPVEITTKASKNAAERKVDQIDGKEESSRRKPKILREELINTKDQQEEQKEDTPEANSLRRRRLRPRRPIYQIFDVNKFLPTTPYPIFNSVHSTVLPKNKVISEVFYKDEIKPNEQLNVFADVLNNIKNSSNFDTLPLQSASNFAEPDAVTISNIEQTNIVPHIKTSSNIRVKKYQQDSSNNQNVIDRNPVQNLATTEKHYNARYPESYEEHHETQYSSTNKNIVDLGFKNPENFGYIDQTTQYRQDEDTNQYKIPTTRKVSTKKFIRRRRKPTKGPTSTTVKTTTKMNIPDHNTPSNHKPYVREVLKDIGVVGLVPPRKWLYKTIVEDSEAKGTDEVPEKVYEYKTIPPNYVTEPLTGPAAVTELIDEDPPARPMNKYYFLGLKPPFNQRARPYSEFLLNKKVVNNGNTNNIGKRMVNVGYGHIRLKREAARASYSEVSRNRGRQNEGIKKETIPYDDVDDYVPHRPKNYHYDEKTGKIVYHNKPQEEKESEEEEEEYEEIPNSPGIYLERAEDATHPTPKKVTTKPLLATATPPPAGQGLLDFVAKLKSNPSYQVIPDPTTPDPSSESSTQETVTVDPKSTNPPEFLSILSKVKSDSKYKFIEDPKESQSKTKSKSTTPEPEYEEEDDEEEEEEGSTPKRRVVRQTDLQIFDIGDYLPKIQTPISSPIPKTPTNFFKKQIVEKIFPKLRYMTPFDIAKEKIRERFQNNTVYQFIQKNIQNSPGGQSQELANIQIFDIGEYLPKIKTVSPKTSIDYSKYKTIERPHTRHNMSSRYNSDEEPKTEEVTAVRRPVIMEERESIDRPVVSEERVVHDKEVEIASKDDVTSTTQRIVQFRRGTRPTTQKTAETIEPTESLVTRRPASRRRPAPSGFRTTRRPTTAEVTEATEKVERVYPQYDSTEKTYSQTHENAKRVYRRRPVRIRYTTERLEEDKDIVDRLVRRSLDSDVDDVRNEFEEEHLEKQIVPEIYETIKKEIVNSDDAEKKESIINHNYEENEDIVSDSTEEIKDKSNNTKKTDGLNDNIEEKEPSESNQKEIVEKDQKYIKIQNEGFDKTIKHGEDIKNKETLEEPKSGNLEEELEVQVDKDTDNPDIIKEESELKEATKNSKKDDVEIVNPDYDKTRKHGGNYRIENEDEEVEKLKEVIFKEKLDPKEAVLLDATYIKPDVEIINDNFDKTKRHGGNYKADEDATTDEILEASQKTAEIQPIESINIARSKKVIAIDDNVGDSDKFLNTKEVVKYVPSNKGSNFANKRKRTKLKANSTKSSSTKTIPRLTDIVPKPDHFYTDTHLPKEVNTLKTGVSEIKLDSKELEKVTEQGDLTDVEELLRRQITRRTYDISEKKRERELIENDAVIKNTNEELVDGEVEDEEEVVSTEKPLFIKDPSKRLYFYAPV